ncbi:MAG TPA: hypothetical protein DCS07_01230 [Bdellovibrionales bacterium]|nr:MAG: hypothetical protein A2Z97_01565 [Bdellovibrionales bacterium GWB1_52_6]OFZ05028.1 MAG: hypothetical protein A2X97_00330 [Bdellovibrionales bacterium GWA1_52_35]OFZ43259.1 MAG: hypothetical protein A2070_12805 [Bdellovibrionales bacterium GWC1_52_8]HAR41249.1 hypothetical protein [Bdellovibrionales bacterium]HCM41261.1 hypothetical protein [Bdellovibrionales bacterium]
MSLKGRFTFALFVVAALLSPFLLSELANAEQTTKRQKMIDFDDELVEGLNKRPLDSLSHLSEAEKRRRKSHLYRKRSGFSTETSQTLQNLRYVQ